MFERILVNFGIPFFVCVVLPVMIVWLVARMRQNETNRRAEIMLKAIEAGVPVDMEQFKAKKKNPKTIKQEMLDKLTGACITFLMGIAFTVYSIVGYLNPEWIDGRIFSQMAPIAGGVLLAVGIGLFITYYTGKKMLAKEMEVEEKKLEQE